MRVYSSCTAPQCPHTPLSRDHHPPPRAFSLFPPFPDAMAYCVRQPRSIAYALLLSSRSLFFSNQCADLEGERNLNRKTLPHPCNAGPETSPPPQIITTKMS